MQLLMVSILRYGSTKVVHIEHSLTSKANGLFTPEIFPPKGKIWVINHMTLRNTTVATVGDRTLSLALFKIRQFDEVSKILRVTPLVASTDYRINIGIHKPDADADSSIDAWINDSITLYHLPDGTGTRLLVYFDGSKVGDYTFFLGHAIEYSVEVL